MRTAAIAAMVWLVTGTVPALASPKCDEFKAAIADGAKQYSLPEPRFTPPTLAPPNDDPDFAFWNIILFNDVQVAMSCERGIVDFFGAETEDRELASNLHLLLVMGIGLHGYGLDWKRALSFRDDLIRAAKAPDKLTAEMPVDDDQASMVFSLYGVPSFEIKANR